jgi:uncharacterized protein (DUF2252 family)
MLQQLKIAGWLSFNVGEAWVDLAERTCSNPRAGYNQSTLKSHPKSKPKPQSKAAPEPARLDTLYAAAHALRKSLKPDELANWNPKLRARSVDELLTESLHDRLPELTAIRYQRMAANAFGFFRGSACVMAYDLSLGANTGIHAQLCGDAHVQNLGAFEGVDGRLIFDINDFDETLAGPFEWDLKRMATSILLAGHEAKIKSGTITEAAETFLNAYAELTQLLFTLPVLEVARFQVHRLGSVAPISKILAQAERATPQLSLEKLTSAYPAGRIFKSNPPLLVRLETDRQEEREKVLASLKPYLRSLLPERRHFFSRFRAIDVAFKVVGTGSVGLRDYTVYMEGNEAGSGRDPLFLQIKQEAPSCYSPYLAHDAKQHQGQRVAEGQRAMQLQSDPLLGWTTIGEHQYLVRQLNDHKASIDLTTLKPKDLCQYASVCGQMLARGHARSGDVRQIAGYLGNGRRFNAAILAFAKSYAGQMQDDWKAFLKQHGEGG